MLGSRGTCGTLHWANCYPGIIANTWHLHHSSFAAVFSRSNSTPGYSKLYGYRSSYHVAISFLCQCKQVVSRHSVSLQPSYSPFFEHLCKGKRRQSSDKLLTGWRLGSAPPPDLFSVYHATVTWFHLQTYYLIPRNSDCWCPHILQKLWGFRRMSLGESDGIYYRSNSAILILWGCRNEVGGTIHCVRYLCQRK